MERHHKQFCDADSSASFHRLAISDIDFTAPRANTYGALWPSLTWEILEVRWILAAAFCVSFMVQQVACCCGSFPMDDEVCQSPACTAEAHSHQHGETDGDVQLQPLHPEHEHHVCVGTHVFLAPLHIPMMDLSPRLSSPILYDVALPSLATGGFGAAVTAADRPPEIGTPQQRRAVLCVYSI